MRITIPNTPHHDDIIQAIVRREELESLYVPLKVPKLKYPSSKLQGASLWAFIRSFAP